MAEERCNLFWSKEFILDNNKEIKEVIEKEIPPIPGVYLIYWPTLLNIQMKHFRLYDKKSLNPLASKNGKRLSKQKLLYIGVTRNLKKRIINHSKKPGPGLAYLYYYDSFRFRFAEIDNKDIDIWAVESIMLREYVETHGHLPVGNEQFTLRGDRSIKYLIVHNPRDVFGLI